MIRIFSPVRGGDFNPCDGAIIELTTDLTRKLLIRKRLFDAVKEQDADCIEHYYWDAAPEWVSDGSDVDTSEEEDEPAEAEEVESVVDQIERQMSLDKPVPGDEITRLPAYVQLAFEPMRSECDQCIVSKEGVTWMCYPKHTDMEVRTEQISWELIAEAAIS